MYEPNLESTPIKLNTTYFNQRGFEASMNYASNPFCFPYRSSLWILVVMLGT